MLIDVNTYNSLLASLHNRTAEHSNHTMANIKSLSDLNGEDGDDNGKFNDYYAGGEKRWDVRSGSMTFRHCQLTHDHAHLSAVVVPCSCQWSADSGSTRGNWMVLLERCRGANGIIPLIIGCWRCLGTWCCTVTAGALLNQLASLLWWWTSSIAVLSILHACNKAASGITHAMHPACCNTFGWLANAAGSGGQ